MCDSCGEEHERILATVQELQTDVREHVHPEIEELAEHLIGPRRSELVGGGRNTAKGLEKRLERVERGQAQIIEKLDNGVRVKRSLEIRDRIYVALITTAGAIAAAWIAVHGASASALPLP